MLTLVSPLEKPRKVSAHLYTDGVDCYRWADVIEKKEDQSS